MIESPASILVGVDYDGTVIKKAGSMDIPRRATKMGLPLLDSAIPGIDALNQQPDVEVLGVYTVRPEWLRKSQTAKQIRRRGIPIETVVHAKGYQGKVERLLQDASRGYEVDAHMGSALAPLRGMHQVVLIDDNAGKIVEAAQKIAREKPQYRNMQALFTVVAFNPKMSADISGTIIPGVAHVIEMQDWSKVEEMLKRLRRYISISHPSYRMPE